MSTKFYGFRASSEDNLYEQVGIAKFLLKDDLFLSIIAEEGIEFQVFRSSAGIVYRVLETGYALENKMWKYPGFFPQCNYDDRVDIPEEDLINIAVADEVNNLIATGQYFIVTIVPAKEADDQNQEREVSN